MSASAIEPPSGSPVMFFNAISPSGLALEAEQKIDDRVTAFLRDMLLSENVVVLAGLGTSMGATLEGSRIAPTMNDLWNEAKNVAGEGFGDLLKIVRYPTEYGEDVEMLLSQCQLAQRFEPSDELTKFITSVERRIASRCSFVTDGVDLTAHEAFLRKLARRSTRMPRLRVFTTNYDLCFETAARRTKFLTIDGFSYADVPDFDGSNFSYDFVRRNTQREQLEFIPNVFHLYKLHGSVDWEHASGRVIKRRSTESPLLIYPRQSKFETSYAQPFLELMSRFQMALRESGTALFVIGFGFKDSHLAEPIMSAVRANVGLRVLVVDPRVDVIAHPVTELRTLLASNDSRIALLKGTFEDLARMVPDLVAATEDEIHEARIRSLVSKP